jgi:hypothetical protein
LGQLPQPDLAVLGGHRSFPPRGSVQFINAW